MPVCHGGQHQQTTFVNYICMFFFNMTYSCIAAVVFKYVCQPVMTYDVVF
jgi:hypothetical protein